MKLSKIRPTTQKEGREGWTDDLLSRDTVHSRDQLSSPTHLLYTRFTPELATWRIAWPYLPLNIPLLTRLCFPHFHLRVRTCNHDLPQYSSRVNVGPCAPNPTQSDQISKPNSNKEPRCMQSVELARITSWSVLSQHGLECPPRYSADQTKACRRMAAEGKNG